MPEGFKFPVGARQIDFWMPLISSIPPGARTARGAVYLGLFARLKPNVTLAQAQAEMNLLANDLATQYPEANTGLNIVPVSTHERLVGQDSPGVARVVGRGRAGAFDRLRQRSKPAPGARFREAKRNRHSHGYWCNALAGGSSAAH